MKGWVPAFCQMKFFEKCDLHADHAENHLNRYCINCDAKVCKNCIGGHVEHDLLKIYRHVYKDAVHITDMQRHMECSMIQEHKSNGNMVIVLQPLRHSGTGEASKRACHECKRKLPDKEQYIFCSIGCKVKTDLRKKRRKGTPHRSPLM